MSTLINKVLFTRAGYGLTILRIFVGIIFAAHGSQKLFGAFGGYGIAGTAQWMESIGLAPGHLMAILAGGTEFFGGLALIIGLLARGRPRPVAARATNMPAAFVAARGVAGPATDHAR